MRPKTKLKKIRKVLIANRGEIAFRISKTLKKLRILRVGLCIPGEKNASYLSLCSEIHSFTKNDLSAFLDLPEIFSIAERAKVDAIHPGYGFLSENPLFSSECEARGIIFLGPTPESMARMGDKNEAKKFAAECGLPVLPTISEEGPFDESFQKRIRTLRLPLILKPLNGGGGKGMVIVRNWDSLFLDLEEARNLAQKAFGDPRLIAEPLIENAKHIEVQIIGDSYGNVRHLYERDCTIQRRHQKIVEESPSPSFSKTFVDRIIKDALQLGQATRYRSLGTVEFLIDRDHHYFMEMNTRLQVEHPVTEMLLGLDLVEKQMKIAQGKYLDEILPSEIVPNGHSMELRIYSEQPEASFRPSTGRIVHASFPPETKELRLDIGVDIGTKIHHAFDPMIAKITAHGNDRKQTVDKLLSALEETVILGVHTNIEYLQWLLRHPSMLGAKHDTTFAQRNLDEYKSSREEIDCGPMIRAFEREKRRKESVWANDPWNFEPNHLRGQWTWQGNQFQFDNGKDPMLKGWVSEDSQNYWIAVKGRVRIVSKSEVFFDSAETSSTRIVRAPMTGTILRVYAKEGLNVKKNDMLIEMESMKMQYRIQAPIDGIVEKVLCKPAETVEQESILLEFAP